MQSTFPVSGPAVVLLALAAALTVVGGGALEAQVPAQDASPGSYALTNARVVVSPDRVLPRATIVIRDGKIAAVGPRVPVPGEGRVIDVSGLTVYPGLIDAAATPRLSPPPAGDRNASNLAPARRAVVVVDLPEDARVAWRSIGVTTLGIAYAGGTDLRREPGAQYRIVQESEPLLPGRTSAVNLGTGPLASLAASGSEAVQVGFGTRTTHEYPVTLMGSIAFVHQAFLDASHQRLVRRSRGAEAQYRAEVEPLEAAAAGEQRVWFTASQASNLRRAMDLAEELELDYVLLGAQEGFRVAERIARSGRPVLLSLAYPPATEATGRNYALDVFGARGGFPDPERVDAEVRRAFRGNAAALVRAGVPVALTSYGLDGAEAFRGALLDVVQSGLSPADALRALTVTPARILGLEDRMGTVEPGKIANLMVVDGDFFTSGAAVRHVFVEGRHHEIPRASTGDRSAARSALRPDEAKP